MIKYWADTSAILHQKLADAKIGISPLTLQELEHIKTNEHASQEIKYKARDAVRRIVKDDGISVIMINNNKIDKMLRKYPFLDNIKKYPLFRFALLYSGIHFLLEKHQLLSHSSV